MVSDERQSRAETAYDIRLQSRSGALRLPTTNRAPGYVQANLIVLPSAAAQDFADLCARNPVPCPVLATTPVGQPGQVIDAARKTFEHEFDVRTDIPLYNIYRDGELIESKQDILDEWTGDHVAFLIGCSFSFEAALAREGLVPRHWEQQCNVPMFRTSKKLNPAGIFTGATYVVSMRPYRPEDIERVRDITRPFLQMHGEPIAWGWDACAELGIDTTKPHFGDAVQFKQGEIPVFWGCGVTPQQCVVAAKSKIKGVVMGHAPGYMMVLDLREEDAVGKKLPN